MAVTNGSIVSIWAIPFLAIGALAGLRVAENCRLDWGAVSLERRIIESRAGQAKTASRRIIPVSANLAAWLEPLDRRGAVIPNRQILRKKRVLARRLGLNWPANALRHSYISYRIAEVQNAAQIALEAGNSPAILQAYRKLVTREEAEQWFRIFPGSGSAGTCPARIDKVHEAIFSIPSTPPESLRYLSWIQCRRRLGRRNCPRSQ